MESIRSAVVATGGPVDLPFGVVAQWLSSGSARRSSKREALMILRSLISKGYLKASLDWDMAHQAVPEIAPVWSGVQRMTARPPQAAVDKPKVFIVHGHDEHLKESAARFIEQLDFEAIVIMDLPSSGRTIIEQVERHSDVQYAVVLLTPDDMPDLDPHNASLARARQNVIFELGYFVGRLGRSRVHCLRKGKLELFSDIDGVIFTAVDNPGADWRLRLAQEMASAGLGVDMNKIFKK
jgi:predicted nucleotide-binding protein